MAVNSRATGNQRERRVGDEFDALGFAYIAVKGSGARGVKMRQRKCPVVGDGLAIPYSREGPFFQVEIGAHTPGAVFRELSKALLPGFRPLFVQFHRKRRKGMKSKRAERRYFIDPHTWFRSLEEALESLQENGY